jgi:phosphopantetheinyl transferase
VDSAAQSQGVRTLLERLLADHPECSRRTWSLHSEPGSAPELYDETGQGLAVSLSHSGSWLLAGVAQGATIGVDVQVADAGRETTAMARFMGWDGEASEDFYASWTLWEALAKCQGLGVLRDNMPGFEALQKAQGGLAMTRSGAWAAWRLQGQQALAASVVLHSSTPLRFELQEQATA